MASWLREKGSTIGAIAGTLAAFVAVLQLFVVNPMNQRFDDLRAYMDQRFEAMDQRFETTDQRINDLSTHMNQRFDAQDQRLDQLTSEVSELRKLTVSIGERLSRSEGQIEIIREQIKTVDAP